MPPIKIELVLWGMAIGLAITLIWIWFTGQRPVF